MADFAIGGSGTYIQYGWEETTYGTASASIDKAFGQDQKVVSWNKNHNLIPIYALGSPDPQKMAAGPFEGSITVEFVLASTYFLKGVIGDADDTIASPDTHVYQYNTGYVVTSLTIEVGVNLDTDNVYQLLGCVVNSCDISCIVGEPIKATVEFLYAEETLATSGFDATPATDLELPMMFSQATLEIPDGTAIAEVQSFVFSIRREARILYGLNDRAGTDAVWGRTRWEFKITVAEENDDFIADAYGAATGPLQNTNPAGEASLELTLTNGETGDDERSLIFLMTKTYLTSDSMTLDVGSVVFHDFVGYCLGYTSITGSDDTAATP